MMKNDILTVRFNCNNKVSKSRNEWIKILINDALRNCQDDVSYNDNTLHDLLRHGFKGYELMNDDELAQDVYDRLEHLFEDQALA
jgi:hypothetical protein